MAVFELEDAQFFSMITGIDVKWLTSSVEDHASRSLEIMLLQTLLLDGLLGHDVSGGEENGGGY